jgi:catechol 2,3-dioxygenase-like lactoylglutathione lyase family enzyme
MKSYLISGIQQMGIGVENVEEAWNWYIDAFGMDCRIFDDNAPARLMLPYTGGEPKNKHAILVMNLQSGGGFEIWQHTERIPVKIKDEIRIGDLGIIACKIKTKNVSEAYALFKQKGIKLLSEKVEDPSGKNTLFLKDPFGNIFQLVEATDWFMDEKKVTGGAYGAVIGVSDVEKAKVVYSGILGYDEVVYDRSEVFNDLAGLPGGNEKCRRVLLKRSKPLRGAFSKMFGESIIELISTVNPGKKTLEGRFWGDPGFIHLCFDMNGMDELKTFCESKGHPFTVDSKKSHDGNSFDMGEAAGYFSYIEDPDGTLIEFVETHRVPILKKLGWYLNMTKRDPERSLPDWIIKTLRFSRVKNR